MNLGTPARALSRRGDRKLGRQKQSAYVALHADAISPGKFCSAHSGKVDSLQSFSLPLTGGAVVVLKLSRGPAARRWKIAKKSHSPKTNQGRIRYAVRQLFIPHPHVSCYRTVVTALFHSIPQLRRLCLL